MQIHALIDVGSRSWLQWHQQLQKLHLQALFEASALKFEHVKETLVTFQKVQILVYEAITCNIWKHKVLPQLLRLQPEPEHTFMVYCILFHEAVSISLLELITYHADSCEALNDYAADLLDYAAGLTSRLLNLKQPMNEDEKPLDNSKDEIQRHSDKLAFEIGIRAITIIRHFSEYLDRLPLDISSRMFSMYDIPGLFAELIFQKPWCRDKEQFIGSKWIPWDGEVICKIEAQVWIGLHQLLMSENCKIFYQLNDQRRQQLSKLIMYLNPNVLDQMSPLVHLKVCLSHLMTMTSEYQSTTQKPLLMESILEVKDSVIKKALLEKTRWRNIAQEQLETIFCTDPKIVQEHAQLLSDAFNTDILEQWEEKQKGKATEKSCEKCGNDAPMRCSNCKGAWYCSRKCQVAHWPSHKCC